MMRMQEDGSSSGTISAPLGAAAPVPAATTAALPLLPLLGPAAPAPEATYLDSKTLERMSVEYAHSRDPRLRESLILHHQRLVRSITARFLGAGETLEDLIQVGNIGLINALDRYDPSQGTRFSTYATPTILGEIKRHFRDKTCGIKIPRWLQELHFVSRRATQQLTGELNRPPTVAEVAQRLGASEEEVLEALNSGEAMNLLSLDSHLDSRGQVDSSTLMDLVGRMDSALKDFEVYGDLRGAIEALERREREVISLRFFDEMSQAKIAKRLNISQMHVSRLQQRALRHLRELLTEDARVTGTVTAAAPTTKSGRRAASRTSP